MNNIIRIIHEFSSQSNKEWQNTMTYKWRCLGKLDSRLAWQRGSAIGHVTYIILLAILLEYFGPIMRAPSGHVIRKSGF